MQAGDLRVALFSGNYNYVRDGANQALNRLVEYLLRQGVKVRIYSPTVEHPAFPATGDLVDVPAFPIPGRSEYHLPVSLSGRVRRDLAEFNPNVIHISSPDFVGHRAVTWARRRRIAVVASVHTRFDTYCAYYGLQFLEPLARGIMLAFGLILGSAAIATAIAFGLGGRDAAGRILERWADAGTPSRPTPPKRIRQAPPSDEQPPLV